MIDRNRLVRQVFNVTLVALILARMTLSVLW
ncbi:hypothetical protein FHR33_000075 [Nonomuraea dietziae]|uniref:Uncharacterized protein n=1 Tax=Nonomuraea dietziae TaxID=65515 RepID=A0A7W5V3M6_9ACTN|nr:hypothetical protein [Nonomuraea dietziae]